MDANDIKIDAYSEIRGKAIQFGIKRISDIILSIIGILILSPIFIILWAWIKLDSKGPALFKQVRVGKNGKNFTIFKFRTMIVSAEAKRELEIDPENMDNFVFQSKSDNRVTKSGKFLRKTSLDEIPQLFNVLKGDMSLIGPRPEQRAFVNQSEREIPFYMYRHIVRPGISGWAQVIHGYAADADDTKIKIEHDFYYIKNFSLWLDVLIIFKTIKTILTGFGAR